MTKKYDIIETTTIETRWGETVTRKKIKDEIDILKQKSIAEIKLYLKKHNIIKIGSMAPDVILRQLYNDSRLAGDIYNNSSENLIHNYINDK